MNKDISKDYIPKVVSIFSGCGGLDLGFHLEGYETVWANDFSEWAVKSFREKFGDVIVHGDITQINPYTDKSIPDPDLILGGFPCQDFSVIWKQPGLNGKRGGLYRHFLEFVDSKKPKAFIAENVKGLLTANKKQAIETIMKDFESIAPGYVVKVHLYNFAEYGVPQFRERVLIVGVRVDTGYNFIHPKPTHGPNTQKPYVTAGEALKGVEEVPLNNEHINSAEKTRRMLDLISEGGNFTDIPKDHPLYVKGMISHVYRRIKLDEPAKTIIAAGGGGTWGYHYPEPRALTNRERARLQSFPDNFEFIGSVAEARRQIGNAVPPEGVRSVARRLKPLFTGEYERIDLYATLDQLSKMTIKERLDLATEEMI
ncbi:DNA cytosine methyltransferase [Paenibacillus crassostreae]|uniref:Cytosine-specific methyltransferase n=1 Tax=Paenibacillus crassostreae TaxID=1763538 RepID=A0A167AQ10_9BACL|nr:DNA cytosine methyltransferase [Paenibacillus crassostreae]AOZ93764.1 DNA (cytosine-5-)-methyltransferase [Paenibacillus crassostreae]OAB71298.1 DNA cytosine methyltransferase [Paenibacillus crassostreae]